MHKSAVTAPLSALRFSARLSDHPNKAVGEFVERRNGQELTAPNEFSGFAMSFSPTDPKLLSVSYQTWGMYLT